MFVMLILFLMTYLISMFLILLNFLISFKKFSSREKMSPFECGFNPFSLPRIPFSINFFLISIIFLIFDVEISFILPMIISFKYSNIFFWMILIYLFMIILIIGIFIEWMNGSINWMY